MKYIKYYGWKVTHRNNKTQILFITWYFKSGFNRLRDRTECKRDHVNVKIPIMYRKFYECVSYVATFSSVCFKVTSGLEY